MKDLFQPIADAICESSESEWTKAELSIEVTGGSVGYKLDFFFDDGSRESEFLEEDGSLSNLLRDYHQRMNTESPKHWNRLTVELESTGKFTSEFEWDQELQDEFEKNSR